MRGVVMHTAGDVRVEDRADPTIIEPTDHQVMGHEHIGVVEQVGADVTSVRPGDFVVGSFVISDNTCEICRAGFQSKCVHTEFVAQTIGTQAEKARIPHADGTLVKTPGTPDPAMYPALPAASDVLGTGWFAAVAAGAGPGKTVAVVRRAPRRRSRHAPSAPPPWRSCCG